MSDIVTKEIKNNAFAFDDEGDHYSRDDSSRCSNDDANDEEHLLLTPRDMNHSPTHHDTTEQFNWTRVRTVSIDSPLHSSLLTPRPMDEDLQKHCSVPLIRPVLISPMSTPIGRGRPVRRASLKFAQKIKQDPIKLPKLPQLPPVTVDVNEYKKKALQSSLVKGVKIQTIGRKKFSWKNYPGKEYHPMLLVEWIIGDFTHHVLSSMQCYRIGSVLDSQPRRIPSPLCTQLYCATEAIQ
jgi:hypothetical protein